MPHADLWICGSLLGWFDPSNHIYVGGSVPFPHILLTNSLGFLPLPSSAPVDVFALSHIPQFLLSSQYQLKSTFPSSFLPQTRCISAWIVDISSWMSACRFKLIFSDNNIVNPAQTTKHLGVIPGSKLSYEALIAATKPSCTFVLLKHWSNHKTHSPGTQNCSSDL